MIAVFETDAAFNRQNETVHHYLLAKNPGKHTRLAVEKTELPAMLGEPGKVFPVAINKPGSAKQPERDGIGQFERKF